MEIHSRTRSAFQRPLGGSSQKLKESSEASSSQAHIRGIRYRAYEVCLNSRPLVSLPCDDDGVEALTPGHFLIGRPMKALPDPSFSYRSLSLLRRWHLCQALVVY